MAPRLPAIIAGGTVTYAYRRPPVDEDGAASPCGLKCTAMGAITWACIIFPMRPQLIDKYI